MNNNQIESVIRKLFETGRSFCSEADFQHALGSAIEKHLADKSVAVRFEFPASKENNEHFDIMLISDGKMNPVELKYKTKHAEVRDSKGDIQYVLRDQAAHDCGRFLFLKDICRLEKYRTEKKETYGHGFAVF